MASEGESGSRYNMEGFSIRAIKTEVEFESIVIKAMEKEKWRPGLKDAECYMAIDPTGAFVGEVNGKPICCITLMKYGDNFGFVGSYIVSKEYRGKGYGNAICNAALSSVKPSRILAFVSFLKHEEMYQKVGYQSHFYGARFDLHLPTAFKCFSDVSEKSPVNIKYVNQVDRETLFAYDSNVFGFPRTEFLSKWFGVQGSKARVAISNEGSVLGYVVVRPTLVKEDGYKIGPLFADSEPIAENLLKSVFEELLQQETSAPVVCMDTFSELGKQLALRLQGKRVLDFVYMTTKGILPKACFDKWVCMTSLESG